MRSIWVRAGVGALAIFVLGMMLYTAVRTTKGRAKDALLAIKAELDSVSVDAADRAVPFVLDGRTLGRVTSLTFAPGAGQGLSALVALDRAELNPVMLSSCDLVPVEPEHFEMAQGFRCATPADRGLRTLGEVRFEPVGVVRPVRGDKATLAQLREYGTITLDSAQAGVHANVSGDSGEIVNIKADSNGALIHVNDGKGKVVYLKADKTGLVVKVDSHPTP
jgi:hypothetical protein